MASLLGGFSEQAESTIVPIIFKFIETQDPTLKDALVDQLNKLKISNSTEFNKFIENWRKINSAMEESANKPVSAALESSALENIQENTGGAAMGVVPAVPVSETIVPSPPVEEKTDTAGTRKRRRHKKRTHRVKHRKH